VGAALPPVSFPVAYDVGISDVSRALWVHAELYHSFLVYACDASEMEGHDRASTQSCLQGLANSVTPS
jgi:hypothetical protein